MFKWQIVIIVMIIATTIVGMVKVAEAKNKRFEMAAMSNASYGYYEYSSKEHRLIFRTYHVNDYIRMLASGEISYEEFKKIMAE